jgi:cell division protein FtsZ
MLDNKEFINLLKTVSFNFVILTYSKIMSYKFEIPNSNRSIIKVIGVGGGGSNAVNYMYHQGIQDVEFVVCNTDSQALKLSPVPNKLQIGSLLTDGLGAGNDPEMGKKSAIEDKDRIREMLTGTKMVFVTAGMGGGTGTGAAPVIAKIAKEMEILTVGIVTKPFNFEGLKKKTLAEEGIAELKEYCDTVIIILNDKIKEMFGSLPIKASFSKSDNILLTAAKSIAEIITNPGLVNIDFQDVNMVMRNAGAAVMGSANATGKDRARKAAESALHSPLLNNTDITGAKKILVLLTATEDSLTMDEYSDVNEYFQDMAGQGALLKSGITIDNNMGDELRVTVIATGFEADFITNIEPKTIIDLESSRQTSVFTPSVSSIAASSKDNPDSFTKVVEASNGIFSKADDGKKVVLDLNSGLEQKPDLFSQSNPKEKTVISDYQKIDDEKKQKAKDDIIYRSGRLKQSSVYASMSKEELDEMYNEPAWRRRNISLVDPPHSSEKEMSRLTLNEDNEILGNNKYLHDNVD